jgi:hypothetical protein
MTAEAWRASGSAETFDRRATWPAQAAQDSSKRGFAALHVSRGPPSHGAYATGTESMARADRAISGFRGISFIREPLSCQVRASEQPVRSSAASRPENRTGAKLWASLCAGYGEKLAGMSVRKESSRRRGAVELRLLPLDACPMTRASALCLALVCAFAPVVRAQGRVSATPNKIAGTLGTPSQVSLVARVTNAANDVEVFVDLGRDSLFYLEAQPETSPDRRTWTFNHITIRPLKYISATPIRLPIWIHLTVDGQPQDSTAVVMDVGPARVTSVIAPELPTNLILRAPTEMRATVVGKIGDDPFPVKGASVGLKLRDGTVQKATSDESGVATFPKVVLTGVPGEDEVTFFVGAVSQPVKVYTALGRTKTLDLQVAGANDFRVGRTFSIAARMTDSLGNSTRDTVIVSLSGTDGGFQAPGQKERSFLTLIPTSAGAASIANVQYYGTAGPMRIIGVAGSVADTVTVVVGPGPATKMRVIQEPSTDIIAESLFAVPPIVRVEDAAGNPVPNTQVLAYLWQTKKTFTGCQRPTNGPAGRPSFCPDTTPEARAAMDTIKPKTYRVEGFIKGVTRRVTDSSGLARFDSLRVVGPDDFYRMEFRYLGMPDTDRGAFTSTIRYDAARAFNKNFVVVSAIRSIGGTVTPPDEFFDIRFRFRFIPYTDVVVQSDLSIVRRTEEKGDSVRSNTKRLIDAMAMWNVPFELHDPLTSVPERNVFFGPQLRIFNTVPYLGVHMGELELAKSLFHGSMFSVSYLRPMQMMPIKVEGEVFRPTRSNLSLDAFVRSSGFDFLKYLNIRGTVLIPLEKGRRTSSRIVLAVPVGSLVTF